VGFIAGDYNMIPLTNCPHKGQRTTRKPSTLGIIEEVNGATLNIAMPKYRSIITKGDQLIPFIPSTRLVFSSSLSFLLTVKQHKT